MNQEKASGDHEAEQLCPGGTFSLFTAHPAALPAHEPGGPILFMEMA